MFHSDAVMTCNDLPVLIHVEAERGKPPTADIEKHFGGIFNKDVKLGLQTLGEMFMCVRRTILWL